MRFPHHNPVHATPLPYTCYMPRPSHSSRFAHPHNIWLAAQIIKLFIMLFSQLTYHLDPLGPKYYPQHPILKNLSLSSFPSVSDQVSHPYKTTGKIIFLYDLIYKFLYSKMLWQHYGVCTVLSVLSETVTQNSEQYKLTCCQYTHHNYDMLPVHTPYI